VYVIHTHGDTFAPDSVSYLGTIVSNLRAAGGTTTTNSASTVRTTYIQQLADMVHPRDQQTMVQVISNAGDGTGWARMSWHYQLDVTVAVTSIRNALSPSGGHNIPWPSGTAWHGTFIHEFGHSFGNLVDEHYDLAAFYHDNRRANFELSTVADANLKWAHWAGHRNVLASPTRFTSGAGAGWTIGMVGEGTSGCLMVASWAKRDFCGVCMAELTRRMALISGETFIGRSPSTTNPLPDTPVVKIPQGSTRILDSAFHGNTSLETIFIPASVNSIGDFAFIGATGLRTIFNLSRTPQTINGTTFAGIDRSTIDVHIPFGMHDTFRAAGWNYFNLIEPVMISNERELANIGSEGRIFELANDIELTREWIPVDDFRGILDGNGKIIKNLFISQDSRRNTAGLFGWIGHPNVIINNLGVHIEVYLQCTQIESSPLTKML